MPISFPFLLFARPALKTLLWIRTDLDPPASGLPSRDGDRARLERELARRLTPHLARDVLRDE